MYSNLFFDTALVKCSQVNKIFHILFYLLLCGSVIEVRAQEIQSDSIVKELLKGWGAPVTEHNQVKLLKSGKAKFADMFEAIRQAKHHVHLEYFNFRNDSIAGALFELLAQKVAEGVEVRALFDAFGNMSNNQPLKNKHLDKIRAKGIEIYKFDPIRFPYVNHVLKRDHRKIVVIDGKKAYTGGMNVADYYLNGTPEVGSWRDMHMRIEGPAVDDLQRIFLKTWNKVTKQQIGGDAYFSAAAGEEANKAASVIEYEGMATPIFESEQVSDSIAGLEENLTDISDGAVIDSISLLQIMQSEFDTLQAGIGPVHTDVELAIVDREPGVTPKLIRHAYAASINMADEKIQLINPYFVPTHSIKKALKKAIKRGVEVEIMISSHSDIPFTPDASLYFAYKLVKRGAKVYLYDKGFHHSKIMMVDDTFCTLGSANLNSRSLRYDYEVNAFIFDKGVTKEMTDMFEADKKDSTELTKEIWKKRSPWKRFVGWFANIFAPFL